MIKKARSKFHSLHLANLRLLWVEKIGQRIFQNAIESVKQFGAFKQWNAHKNISSIALTYNKDILVILYKAKHTATGSKQAAVAANDLALAGHVRPQSGFLVEDL